MQDRSTLKVLVAEDEPAMLSLVARHLRRLGFSVTEASDGDAAWEQAQNVRPDLVLLDVMMPGMSGWEVCKRLKGDGIDSAPFRRTGVVMLTGIGDNLNEMTSPLFAADTWLNKPFYFPDLERKIRETLGKYGRAMPIADLEDDEEAAAEEEASMLGREDDEDEGEPAPAPRKAAPRKAAPKRAPKKAAPKKAAAKKAAPKKAAPKKAAAKKKKAAPKKAAKKAAPKKAAKKAAPKKAAKKAAPKKAAKKKAAPKKAAKKKKAR